MGNDLLYKVVRNIKTKPHLRRKLKIFLAIGVVGFLITGALVTLAGISAYNYVAGKTTEVLQSPLAKAQIESLKSEAQALPKLKPLSCWGKVQSLMDVVPWLERPVLENFLSLRVSCLEQSGPSTDSQKEWESK